jgi:hypothetical protein
MEDSNMWMDITDNDLNIQDPFELEAMDLYHNMPVSLPSSYSVSAPFSTAFQPVQPPAIQHDLTSSSHSLQFIPGKPVIQPELLLDEKMIYDEDYLVALDSDTFQDYVDKLRHRRALTKNEELLFKKLYKKIKNRESARKSRQAKKEISQELDEQVLILTQKEQQLQLEIAALLAVNQQIKSEISFTEKLIASNPFLSKLYSKTWGDLVQPNIKTEFVKFPMNEATRCTGPVPEFISSKGVTVNS